MSLFFKEKPALLIEIKYNRGMILKNFPALEHDLAAVDIRARGGFFLAVSGFGAWGVGGGQPWVINMLLNNFQHLLQRCRGVWGRNS